LLSQPLSSSASITKDIINFGLRVCTFGLENAALYSEDAEFDTDVFIHDGL